MNVMDFLDDFILGPLDLIDELTAPVKLRSVRMDKIRIPRSDKTGGATLNQVMAHLRRHGVDCAPGNFNASEMTFYVRKSQRKWLDWLVRFDSDGAVTLVSAQKRWKDKRR